ncbi:probable RNA-dependent RNA polymerase 4 isoform X1 [Selaginella moellendorffii]|uniref:probable RNA-dependent RNA polymerase 4 isoform X1 n=1 Tax=Selaginella moellendorffii TaxID=88036 RepID=UPI000D1C9072|nr:probable RNA-dependent RNA polymerase 4 isoform X1 [Selaginella moellendorffii]|eukprot:XP_024533950.1 probable RNA-dependent RNA polymerase 4 isoform X1 [Selaginella moellendorffii]
MMGDEEEPVARKRLFHGWSQDDVEEFLEQDDAVMSQLPVSSEDRALGELDFYKRYLIQCLAKGRLGVEELRRMKDVKCEAFESYLCSLVNARQRLPLNNSAPRVPKSLMYTCDVDEHGRISYQRPYYEDGRTPLQRAFGDDKVLQVRFNCQGVTSPEMYRDIIERGFDVGLRHFEYFVHKEEKKRKNMRKVKQTRQQRSFFVCTKSIAASDLVDPHFLKFRSMDACRKYIMHIHTVPCLQLYNKRLQLALSKTWTANVNMSEVNVVCFKDIPCRHDPGGEIAVGCNGKPLIHTDGTGFISEDLAKQVAVNTSEEYPALLQVRLFYHGIAVKGTLLTLKTLQHKTIVYRDSMLKVKADPKLANCPSFNSLEICTTSHKPPVASLSRYVIALLLEGGVPESFFIQVVQEAIAKAMTPLQDIAAAHRLCSRFSFGDMPRRMILAGIPLTDHFLRNSLMTMIRTQLKRYAKANVPLEGSYYLMGSADPTNTLARNQVAILLENGPLHRHKVLVYKHPGMHPGDVHVFEATWNQELESCLGNSKYVIIFPTKGPRSVVHEIANSDLDGDLYWICTNEQVSNLYKPQLPWQEKRTNGTTAVPSCLGMSPEVIMSRLVAMFLRAIFKPNFAISRAATNWLIHMDKYLSTSFDNVREREFRQNCLLELADLYYLALDADKTGEMVTIEDRLLCDKIKPHFLVEENSNNPNRRKIQQQDNVYRSTSIFGKIYNLVTEVIENEAKEFTGPLMFYEEFVYGNYLSYKDLWRQHFNNYRLEISLALDEKSAEKTDEIAAQYCQMLYTGSTNLDGAKKSIYQIYQESCAIYSVVHDHVQFCLDRARAGSENEKEWKPSFTFAWKVAGEPLCHLFCERRKESGGTFSVARDVLDTITGAPGALARLRRF